MNTIKLATIPVGKTDIEDVVTITLLEPQTWLTEEAINSLKKYVEETHFGIRDFWRIHEYANQVATQYKLEALMYRGQLRTLGIHVHTSEVFNEELNIVTTEWILVNTTKTLTTISEYDASKLGLNV